MSFHYFLPGVDGPAVNGEIEFTEFDRFGLGLSLYDIKRAPEDAAAYSITIDGDAGLFVTPYVGGAAPPVITYQPNKQTWHRVDLADGLYVLIGWDNDNLPGPSNLQRDPVYLGYVIEDSSGNKWQIPIARAGVNRVTLPSDYDFDPITLKPIEVPSDDYTEIWRISGELYDHWNTENFTLPPAKQAEYALRAIAINYRVGPIEARAFRAMGRKIMDSTTALRIGFALIDAQMLDEFKKKPEPMDSKSPADVG